MANIWDKIEQLLLLGTNRSAISEQIRQQMRQLGLGDDLPEAELLLQYHSFAYLLKKGAKKLPQLEQLPAALQEEKQARPNARISRLVERIVQDQALQPIFEEYIRYSSSIQLLLPPETLPYVFEQFKNDIEMVEAVQPIMGNMGAWLATQNQDWAIFYPLSQEELWQYGTDEDRKQVLVQMRKRDRALALHQVKKAWPKSAIRQQLLFLEALAVDLGPDDQTFLIDQLAISQNASIRQSIARLLTQIPESNWANEVIDLMKKIARLDEHDLLRLFLPHEPALFLRELEAIGFPKDGPRKISKRKLESIFLFLSALMPPRAWPEVLNCSVAQVLPILRQFSNFRSLRERLVESIRLHKDIVWMKLLLQPLLDQNLHQWDYRGIRELVLELPYSVFYDLTTGYVAFHKNIIPSSSLMYFIMLRSKHLWPQELCLPIVQLFQDYLMYSKTAFQDDADHYEDLLEALALRAEPYLFTQLQVGWPHGSFAWFRWEAPVQKMLRILHLRSDLQEAFEVVDEA